MNAHKYGVLKVFSVAFRTLFIFSVMEKRLKKGAVYDTLPVDTDLRGKIHAGH